MKCTWVKCSDSLSKRVSNIIIRYIDHMNVWCFYGFFVYHLVSCSFGFIFITIYIWLYVLYASV